MLIIGNCLISYDDKLGKVIVTVLHFSDLFIQAEAAIAAAKRIAREKSAQSIEYWAGGRLVTTSQAAQSSGAVEN